MSTILGIMNHPMEAKGDMVEPRKILDELWMVRSLKLKIPLFHGKNDLNMYLEWEKKIELVSDCHYKKTQL
ncbi:hypothetical protein Bca101_026883 [Brassica carinata]